jgi:pterin-4a-carbinolamine dehydratase
MTTPQLSSKAPSRSSRLKAERIQKFLDENPTWRLADDGRSLSTCSPMSDPAIAVGRVAWVLALATCQGRTPRICVIGTTVEITIEPSQEEFSDAELHFAQSLSFGRGSANGAAPSTPAASGS